MQEYTILPEIGIKNGKSFWDQVNKEASMTEGEGIVTYMRLMLEMSNSKRYALTRKRLKKLAEKIHYFQGVENYFKRINNYVKKQFGGDVELRHYIISAGLKEIISGTKLAKYFYKVFAKTKILQIRPPLWHSPMD